MIIQMIIQMFNRVRFSSIWMKRKVVCRIIQKANPMARKKIIKIQVIILLMINNSFSKIMFNCRLLFQNNYQQIKMKLHCLKRRLPELNKL